MGIANLLGQFVADTAYEDLPKPAIEAAKDRLLDFLGGAAFESHGDMVRPLLDTIKGCAGVKQSTVIGRRSRLPSHVAAFLNSAMAFDTGDIPHTGVMAIAAALAVSERESKTRRISGNELILAIVLGYEVAIRVEHSMVPSAFARGFDPTGIVGPLAAAASAAKMMRLDAAAMAHAISIAASLGVGSVEASRPARPFILVQVGRACEAGVMAASLAQAGLKGGDMMLERGFVPAFTDRLEAASIRNGLGKDFGISRTSMKMHGGCRCLHAPVDAISQLVNDHAISFGDVKKLKARVCPGTITERLDLEYPENGEAARFSTPYALASFLVYGDSFQDKFTDARLRDRRIQQLIARTTIERDPALGKQSPRKEAVVIEVLTRDGRTLSQRVDFARGDPEWPLSHAEIRAKFNRMAARSWKAPQRQAIIGQVNKLGTARDLAKLFALVGGAQTM